MNTPRLWISPDGRKFLKNIWNPSRGKGGGYKLIRRPEEYTVGSILKITEGSFAPVACLEHSPNQCERVAYCKTLPMWEGFQKLAENYFNGITIQDLMNQNNDVDDYVI